MKTADLETRRAFWKYTSAHTTFSAASEALKEMRNDKISTNLRYAMVCAFIVLAVRPFKQKKTVRLDEALIPREFKALFKHLVTLRDKTYAHMDPDGLDDSDLVYNKARIKVSGSGMASSINFFRLTPTEAAKAEKMLEALITKCKYHGAKIWNKYIKNETIPDGEFEIPLGNADSPMLVPFIAFVPSAKG